MKKPEGFADETEISFVPMSAVDDETGTIAAPEKRAISDAWKGYKRFQNRDVIFARITPCMENGKAAIADNLINGLGCGSTEFHVFRADPNEVVPEWIFYFVRQQIFRNEAATSFTGTAGQLRVPASFLEEKPIPVPSIPEQKRIVSRIKDVLQKASVARSSLETTPGLLKAFRQSVLAAAFRGELTERNPSDEPAAVLLERIRDERHRKWEEDLRAKGKDPEKYAYPEPSALDTSYLPELPEGWVWTNLETIADVRSGVTKGRDLSRFETIEVPYLRVANVQAGFLDLSEVKTIQIKDQELERYQLQVNDVLFTEGGDRDKLGRGTVWKGEIDPCIHQNHIFSARLYLSDVNPEWVSYTSQLEYARNYVDLVASQSVNLASINSTNLKAMPIPLPSSQEQLRMVERIKELTEQVEVIEKATITASLRLDALDQAALAKAFRGEL